MGAACLFSSSLCMETDLKNKVVDLMESDLETLFETNIKLDAVDSESTESVPAFSFIQECILEFYEGNVFISYFTRVTQVIESILIKKNHAESSLKTEDDAKFFSSKKHVYEFVKTLLDTIRTIYKENSADIPAPTFCIWHVYLSELDLIDPAVLKDYSLLLEFHHASTSDRTMFPIFKMSLSEPSKKFYFQNMLIEISKANPTFTMSECVSLEVACHILARINSWDIVDLSSMELRLNEFMSAHIWTHYMFFFSKNYRKLAKKDALTDSHAAIYFLFHTSEQLSAKAFYSILDYRVDIDTEDHVMLSACMDVAFHILLTIICNHHSTIGSTHTINITLRD